jgi:hypothetical protein
MYPIGSGDQLTVLCAISKKSNRYPDIGWSLWWLGFRVHEKYWLGRLRSLAMLYDTRLSIDFGLATKGAPISDLKTHRTTNVIFRRLRKRIGPLDEFNSLMTSVSEIINGQFEGWSMSAAGQGKDNLLDKKAIGEIWETLDSRDKDILRDKKVVGKALGIKLPRNLKDAAAISTYPPEIEPALRLLSDRIGGTSLTGVLSACPHENLFIARNKLRCILNVAQFFERGLRKEEIDDATADMIAALRPYASSLKPKDQIIFLLFFLTLMEDRNFNYNVDAFVDLFIAEIHENAISQEKVDQLRRSDPVLADLLTYSETHRPS